MTHVKALREAGVPLAIRVFKGGLTRTFTSLRNKARQLSGKKESRKKALSHDRFSTAQQPGPMSAEAFEVREVVEGAIEMARAGWADEAAKHERRTRGDDA